MNNFFSNFDWPNLLRNNNVEISVSLFYKILNEAITTYVPKVQICNNTYPKWFTPEFKTLINKKKFYHRECKLEGSVQSYKTFSDLRSECKRLHKICYLNYINCIEKSISSGANGFWNYINSLKETTKIVQC